MRKLINDLRQQPAITAVTIVGTALSIFLIMTVVTLQQATIVSVKPESNRHRTLFATSLCAYEGESTRSSALGRPIVDAVFSEMETPELVSVYHKWNDERTISAEGRNSSLIDARNTDSNYFRIFDLGFLAGEPYDSAAVASRLKQAVISESLARSLFSGVATAVGRTVEIDGVPYTVKGVVEDVSPVMSRAYSQVWIPLPEPDNDEWSVKYSMGSYAVAMLVGEGKPESDVIDEVNYRLSLFNSAHAGDSLVFNLNGGPFTQDEELNQRGSNNPPDMKRVHLTRLSVFAILLLIPAINLGSVTRSRLSGRLAEIGVRRAFGATRVRIMFQIFFENLLVTVAGGIIGLLLSTLFGAILFDTIFSAGMFETYNSSATIGAGVLFNWSIFAYVILFCFILNLLSSGLPAWRASRVCVVEAINSKLR